MESATQKSSDPRRLPAVKNAIFFTASDGVSGLEIWRSDGTETGTSIVADLNPGGGSAFSGLSDGDPFAVMADTMYFSAIDGTAGSGLWKADGSKAGTSRVGGLSLLEEEFAVIGETLFFSAAGENGVGRWRSDSTTAGTSLVSSVSHPIVTIAGSEPRHLTVVGPSVFFTAISSPDTGRERWRSDGTAAGTRLVADILPGSGSSDPGNLNLVSNTLDFSAKGDEIPGRQLWAQNISGEWHSDSRSTYAIHRLATSDGREGETLQFRITRTGDTDQAGEVGVSTRSGSATAGVDFRSLHQMITFAPGQTTARVSVDAFWDVATEGRETFSLNLSRTSNRDRIGTASVSGRINDVQPRYAGVDKDGQPFTIKDYTDHNVTGGFTFFRRSDPSWSVAFHGTRRAFDFSRPTYVYIHGWKDSADSENSQIMEAALASRGANVLHVDWSAMAAIDSALQPTKAVTATQQVGETVADFLIKTGLPLASVTLIGHSLGSLVATSAAREIKTRTDQLIAELVALDTAFGINYDIDGRSSRIDAPLTFNTGLASTTTSFTVSDLIGGIPTLAGDRDRAATADQAYLVQYARSRDLPWFSPDALLSPEAIFTNAAEQASGLHNGVIGVYADLFARQALDPGAIPIRQRFDACGRPDAAGAFDGVVVAPLPWSYPQEQTPIRRAPRAIGWTNDDDDPVIAGSNAEDVMFFDLFRDERDSVSLRGRGGDDWLIADQTDGRGIDRLTGGPGADQFWFGYRRYGVEVRHPYRDRLDATGYGGLAYAVVTDFRADQDQLNFALGASRITGRPGSAIDDGLVARWGPGVGFLARGDLIAYVPGLTLSQVAELTASDRLAFARRPDLDNGDHLFFPLPSS